MKMEACEIISVLCVAILPTVFVGALVYHYGQPLDDGLMCVALMIFLALIILWMVTRFCKPKKNNDDRVDLIDDPEIFVEEIAPKSPSFPDQTPIFTPVISSVSSAATTVNPITVLPVAATQGQASTSTFESDPSPVYVLPTETDYYLPSYEVAVRTNASPLNPSYSANMDLPK